MDVISRGREFVRDARVKHCKQLYRAHEDNLDFLTWLFNPHESHSLGDEFFHELLRQIITAYENSSGIYRSAFQMNEFFDDWDVLSIEEESFLDNLLIERKFHTGKTGTG